MGAGMRRLLLILALATWACTGGGGLEDQAVRVCVIPDTQCLTNDDPFVWGCAQHAALDLGLNRADWEAAHLAGDPDAVAVWEDYLQVNTEAWLTSAAWVAAHCDLAIHEGDVIQSGDEVPLDPDAVAAQWITALAGFDLITAAGVPLVVARGNHDDVSSFLTYLGTDSPSGVTSAVRLDLKGVRPALVVALAHTNERFAQDLDWLRDRIAEHPRVPVFVVGHNLLLPNGNPANTQRWLDLFGEDTDKPVMLVAGHLGMTYHRSFGSFMGSRTHIRALQNWQVAPHSSFARFTVVKLHPHTDAVTLRDCAPYLGEDFDAGTCTSPNFPVGGVLDGMMEVW